MKRLNAAYRTLSLIIALALIAASCGGSDDGGDSGEVGSGDNNMTESVDGGNGGDSGSESADSGTETSADTAPAAPADGSVLGLIKDLAGSAGETPNRGGTIRYLLEADTDGLNPMSSAFAVSGRVMANAVFDSLVVFDEDGQWQPFLAESLVPNADFTEWTLALRPGVTFHDGTTLDAAGFEFGFNVVYADPLVGLAVRPTFKDAETALEVIDDMTVKFTLARPMVDFPSVLTTQVGLVASPTWLAAALEDPTLNQAPVGSGPFIFEGRSEDSVTRFVRNDNWWNGEVYLDAIEFAPIPDPNTRNDLFFQDEAQALHVSDPSQILDLVDSGLAQTITDESGEEFFVMVNTARAPFDDIRVRKALSFTTPRQNYLDLIGLGELTPADQMFTPSSPYYNASVTQEADIPDQATALIAEYCADAPEDECTDGRVNMELQWSGPSVVQTRIAELLDQGWKSHFNVKYQELPQDAHIQEVAVGLFDVVTWRQFGAVNPADDRIWMECSTISGLSLNWPRYCDPARDAILDQLNLATTPEERQPLLAELVQNINESYAYVFLNHTKWVSGFADNVRGMCDHKTPDGVTMLCANVGYTWHANLWLAE